MRLMTLNLLAMIAILSACSLEADPPPVDAPAPPPTLRIATYNVSLYANEAGGVSRRLESGDEDARRIAAVIQRLRPDVLLLNEFDFDAAARAADLFQQRYLEVGQHGQAPIRYEHRFLAPVNTGVPSGLDLDQDGRSEGGNDAWGYGRHPGQYGMLVLSRYPIDRAQVRTFQQLRWAAMPGAKRPQQPDGTSFYPDEVWNQLRLSSKSHWDVPLRTPLGTLHFLVSHPTPPVFDGPEDRNGRRNFDEIRLWADYVGGGDASWLCDDQGRCGALAADALFVIGGDQNADPTDGDSEPGAIAQLLQHPRIDASFVPTADGGAARAAEHGLARSGDPRSHTGDFGPRSGTLRLDYLLPSRGLQVRDGGIEWPVSTPGAVALTEASDHHLVWLDLEPASPPAVKE